MSQNTKKAIFRGDFDPFHVGHAYAIEKSLGIVSRVRIYVTRMMHQETIFASIDERIKIIKGWIEQSGDLDGLVEVYSGKYADLYQGGYNTEICGSDIFNFYGEYNWKSFNALQEFIVIQRPGDIVCDGVLEKYTKLGDRSLHIIPRLSREGFNYAKSNISSTLIRNRLKQKKQITGFVPDGLESVIQEIYKPYLNRL